MKTRLLTLVLILFAAFAIPVANTGCSTAPAKREVIAVKTLESVGQAAEASVILGAKLYRDGVITAAQARTINEFYDQKFQPAFRVARDAVKADLSSIASPDVVALAAELASLVSQFQSHTP